MTQLGILGAGSWGTALGVHFAGADGEVTLWTRSEEMAAALERDRRNDRYLPGIEFPESLRVSADMDALLDCDPVLIVIPSHGYRQVVRDFLRRLSAESTPTLVSCTKGIEVETTARMSQVTFEEALAADRETHFAVLSGPTFADELAMGMPTAAVVACEDEDRAAHLRHRLSSSRFRLYSSSDVTGVELGGTAKNVVAIAAGVVTGLGFGHNTRAALLTRGLHEITRLGVACGGRPRTFAGLAGLGDLVLTCTGGQSRNRRTGEMLAAGRSLAEIESSTPMVAEGVRNSVSLHRLAQQKGIEMPIVEQMVQVIYEGLDPREAIQELMTRELKAEAEL